MFITSTNPATGETLKKYTLLTTTEVSEKLDQAELAFKKWRDSSFASRQAVLLKVAALLREKKSEYAKIMSLEMGKRIAEGIAEVEKCAWVCEHYANQAEKMLAPAQQPTEAKASYVRFEPLGIVLAIMPWNFPFWQVFRAAAPALMAGNVMVLKHASSVPESALTIEKIFTAAGLPTGVFQSLLIASNMVEPIIADSRVRMVSLTGSEAAGSQVASLAGKYIKKSVLELGGSDPFIVLDDADIAKAAEVAATARMIVSGQSCIAAKRFIIHQKVAAQFLELFAHHLTAKKIGDPLDPETGVGPLSSAAAVELIDDQVKRSVAQGAKIVIGGKKHAGPGFFYPPTILTDVTPDMPVMIEETFGPVAAVYIVKTDSEAITTANHTRFGLGASVWTQDQQRAKRYIEQLPVGGVFINSMVKSDPRMPFGGSKFSGYGRELAEYGLKEFVNIKSVWVEA